MKSEKYICAVMITAFLAVYCFAYFVISANVSKTVSLLSENGYTIVIDAGHGGEDGGAVGVSGMKESDLNLEIALRLEQLLSLCGVPCSMIRSEDVSVYTEGNTITEKKVSDLKRRVEMVQTTENPVLVSIHQNHFSDEKYDGAQVFYSSASGSNSLAQMMQQMLREQLDPRNHRECKPADSVYLMERTNCPGVLVECGFLSNPAEEHLLQEPNYQTKLVCVLGCSLTQFLEEGIRLEV